MGEKLTLRQRKALETLVETGNVSQAADVAQVSRVTVHKWLKEEDFKAELRAAELDALEAFGRELVSLSRETAEVLRAALTDESTSVRLRAAQMVLDGILRVRELVSFEERLTTLEALAMNGGAGNGESDNMKVRVMYDWQDYAENSR